MTGRRVYSEFRYYSPVEDLLISRISMANDKGAEFFVEIIGEGKAYRKAKEAALASLVEAIDSGHEPGRVGSGRTLA